MRLKYEPASEPLRISVKQLFLNEPFTLVLANLETRITRRPQGQERITRSAPPAFEKMWHM